MNRFSLLLIISAFCRISASFAQNIVDYDWGEAIFDEAPGAMYDTTAAYFIKSFNHLEMVYNDEGELAGYQLIHNKIKVNNNDALERFNKIVFSLNSFNDIITLKARFIGKNGKVIELDKSHLKSVEEEETSYMLLAMEGAEAGGIIEYFWVRKGYRNLFGSHVLQTNYPKRHLIFEIICPANLQFIAKSYNGAPSANETIDTVAMTRSLLLESFDIPALNRERESFYEANLQRVEYTIAYNYGNNIDRIFDSSQLARYIQSGITTLQPDEQKSLKTVAKKIKLSKKMTTEEKIRFIENYVKTNYQLIDDKVAGLDITTIPGIVDTKYANETGYTRLFAALFNHFSISFELLITCDKTERRFDKDFDGYNFMDKYLFYFPEMKDFIDPNSMYNRMGVIGSEFIGNAAFFLRPVNANGIDLLIPYFGQIPENDYTKSVQITKADIKIFPLEPSTKYTIMHSFSGYSASILQPYMYFASNENKQIIVNEYLIADKSSNILSELEILNYKPAEWFVKPLEIKGTLTGNMLINRAGNDLVFRIGELIGKQVEMYQEKDRKLPVESEIARSYERILNVEIPEGYKIINPEALIMKTELIENGDVAAYFYSDYTLTEKELTVKCNEVYKKSLFPAEKYSEYVAVINAAADFNKIVLILKK